LNLFISTRIQKKTKLPELNPLSREHYRKWLRL